MLTPDQSQPIQSQPETRSVDPVQQELKARELSRIEGRDFECVTYKNGEKITRTRMEVERPYFMEPLYGKGMMAVASTLIECSRTGSVSEDTPHAGGGSGFANKDSATGYPELNPFISKLRSWMSSSHHESHMPSILAVPAVLAGHGNMHPLALLNPKVLAAVVKDSVFPFHKVKGFDLLRGKSAASEAGGIISSQSVLNGYDGFVARISPYRYSPESKGGFVERVEILVFNPRLLQDTAKEDRKAVVPAAQNSLFEFNVAGDSGTVFLHSTPYSDEKFNACDEVTAASIDRGRGEYGFYIKVDRAFVDMLAEIAPLPLHASDCGESIGLLKLNRDFETERRLAWESHERLESLGRNAEAIKLLSEESYETGEVVPQAQGTRVLVRSQAKPTGNGGLAVVEDRKPVPPTLVDGIGAFLGLSEGELRSIVKIPPGQTTFRLEMPM